MATKLCSICGKREGVLVDRVTENNRTVEYAYCEECYSRALGSGVIPYELARKRAARRGKECEACGCTQERFAASGLLGCPKCYDNMRPIALSAAAGLYAPPSVAELARRTPPLSEKERLYASANVVSSRVRLARNVFGLPFPSELRGTDGRMNALFADAIRCSDGIFVAEARKMPELDPLTKRALIEAHFISPALASSRIGAVIMESGDPEISVMLFEEDHIREQCIKDGFALEAAYERLARYDRRLEGVLPIAKDPEFGYLTACPTNLGTGMRASVMLFLPALKRTGALSAAMRNAKERYGLTVRGYFGEGSEAAYDMYQVSNAYMLGLGAEDTIGLVARGAFELCLLERDALACLEADERTALYDAIDRSYGLLNSAYSLTSAELMERLVFVRIGCILGRLPLASMRPLNRLIWECASAFEILNDAKTVEQRNIARANIVRARLREAMQ